MECSDPRECCRELTRIWTALDATNNGKSASENVSALRAQVAALHIGLREFYEAVPWGDPENCEDCADTEDNADDPRPCVLHGERSNRLFAASRHAAELLGPCTCGHACSQHYDEDTSRCKECRCGRFTLPALTV